MIVHLTAEAQRDLESIGDVIPEHAVSFVQSLRAKCLALADLPEGFPLVSRYERHGVRHRAYGNYLISYRVIQDRGVVIHVLHGARDYAAILFPS